MGLTLSKVFTRLFGKKEMRILMASGWPAGLGVNWEKGSCSTRPRRMYGAPTRCCSCSCVGHSPPLRRTHHRLLHVHRGVAVRIRPAGGAGRCR